MREKKQYKVNFTHLTEGEKKELKGRIIESVYNFKRSKKRIKYTIGIAASIAILISIGIFNYASKSSSISDYVKTTKKIDTINSDKVKLILSDKQNIDIDEENSNIVYSNTGQQVKIGNTKSINQSSVNNNKVAYNTLIVPYGTRSKVKLSDGSMVWLNSGSKLVYPIVFNSAKREVYLEGEAIFEVTHNKAHPFMIMIDNHEIEVLGTVFNVSNYLDENIINTTLKSGSIQINYKGDSFFKPKKTFKVSPGNMTSFNKTTNHLNSKKVDVEKHFAWRKGIFIFKNDNLEYIMKKLSRYYNVDIVIEDDNIANQTFTGYLDLKDNVERVVQVIKESTSFEYNKVTNDKIIIK
ncbi:MAG: FecR domain-containing protein [Bacteroidota bacterium]